MPKGIGYKNSKEKLKLRQQLKRSSMPTIEETSVVQARKNVPKPIIKNQEKRAKKLAPKLDMLLKLRKKKAK